MHWSLPFMQICTSNHQEDYCHGLAADHNDSTHACPKFSSISWHLAILLVCVHVAGCGGSYCCIRSHYLTHGYVAVHAAFCCRKDCTSVALMLSAKCNSHYCHCDCSIMDQFLEFGWLANSSIICYFSAHINTLCNMFEFQV